MVGETWENWKLNIRRTIELSPESVTIYQMELPYNTVYSSDILGNQVEIPVADWPTKREWVDYAFNELSNAGYHVSSAYTMIKDPSQVSFSYRDNLWKGSDLLATGIASFGHISGVHYQNLPEWKDYIGSLLEENRLPLGRALQPSEDQLLIREMILQLKRGYLDVSYFEEKFATNILQRWSAVWARYAEDGMLSHTDSRIELTRQGLLRVDALLPAFFAEEHQGIRYT
jgi:oxygen-independent coproporphyrinogen-3 oxidase